MAPDVTEKRMFGSLGFIVRGKLCIGAQPERLMVRIDPAMHDDLLATDRCSTVVMKGREYRGYVYVAAEVLTDEEALQHWVRLALDYNGTL